MRRLLVCIGLPSLSLLAAVGALWAAAPVAARAIISLERFTLRVQGGQRGAQRVYPAGLGRAPGGASDRQLVGTFFTGPDPHDRELFDPSRVLPAFHRGLPFLRLDSTSQRVPPSDAAARPSRPGGGAAASGRSGGRSHGHRSLRSRLRPFGIHGPVTPSLIWGAVSAGCVRLRENDLRELFDIALRHPRMPIGFVIGPDLLDGKLVEPDPSRMPIPGCPEAALGVRRLQRLGANGHVRDRVCGGVDHWYAISLQGGDLIAVELQHEGELRLELYGMRAISPVAAGTFGLEHLVPLARRNRGDRYLRITRSAERGASGSAVEARQPTSYSLRLSLFGAPPGNDGAEAWSGGAEERGQGRP